ncbi:MAG: DMT family transporter [Lachnospiraceae bacterium]|nr:DMT family transporter [Lachnospiraceae bacterium]
MTQQSNTRKATLAALCACVIFGFSFMASRIAMAHTTPNMLLSLRFVAALLIMSLLMLFGAGRLKLKGKPLGRFLLLGLCQPVIYFIGESNGIKFTNSSFSGIMIALIPVITALLSAVLLHEQLKLKRMIWILCSLTGVVLISLTQEGGAIQFKGILFLLLADLAAAMFTILSRSLSDDFTPFERTYVIMLMGSLFFTGFAVVEEGDNYAAALRAAVTDPNVLLPVLYLSVLSSVVAFFCQNYAATYLRAAQVVTFTNITPIVSVLAGTLLLGEPFSLIHIPGIVLILLGVYMVNRNE